MAKTKSKPISKRPRGSVSRDTSKLIGAYVEDPMVRAIDQAVHLLDTDRSKFFRNAIREKLERHGLKVA